MFQKQQQNTATSAQNNNIIYLDERRRERREKTHKKTSATEARQIYIERREKIEANDKKTKREREKREKTPNYACECVFRFFRFLRSRIVSAAHILTGSIMVRSSPLLLLLLLLYTLLIRRNMTTKKHIRSLVHNCQNFGPITERDERKNEHKNEIDGQHYK